MQVAIECAMKASNINEIPVGAVITLNSNIIATSYNYVQNGKNAVFHAEMLAIISACQYLSSKTLVNCDLYTTLEPCYMCLGAIANAKIRRLYIGCEDERYGGVLNGLQVFKNGNINHKPEIYCGIMEDECKKIIQDFFQKLRNK